MEMMRKPLPPRLRYQEVLADVERVLARGTAPGLARVLTLLSSNCTAEAFYAAVTETHPEIAASYLRTIRRPIDLSRIMRRAVAGAYNSVDGMARCRRNVRRMLFNAEAFNSEDPLICSLAGHLRTFFDDLWLTMYKPGSGRKDQPITRITGRASTSAASDGDADGSRHLRGELLRGAGLPEVDLRSCVDIVDEIVGIYRSIMPRDYFGFTRGEQQQQQQQHGGCKMCGETLIWDLLAQTRSWLLTAADAARAQSFCSNKRHLKGCERPPMQGRVEDTESEVQQGSGTLAVDSSSATAAGKEGGSGINANGSVAAAEAMRLSQALASMSQFEPVCLEAPMDASDDGRSEEETANFPVLPVVASEIDFDAFQSRMNDNFAAMENFEVRSSSSPAGHEAMSNFWITRQLENQGALPSSLQLSEAWSLALHAMQDCFSLRRDELAVALRERITRGSSQSSVWASPIGVYWATPLNAKHSRPWPALLLAGEGITKMSSEIGILNLRRIPEGIKQQLKRQRKPTREQLALVEFLGTHEFAWVRSSSLILFGGESPCNSSSGSRRSAVSTTARNLTDAGAALPVKRGRPGRSNGGSSFAFNAGRQVKPNRKFQEALHEAASFLKCGFGLLRRESVCDIPLPIKTPDWFLVRKRGARHSAKAPQRLTKRWDAGSTTGCCIGGKLGMVTRHVPDDKDGVGDDSDEDDDYMEADYGTASSSSDEEDVVGVFEIGGILLDPSSGCPWRNEGSSDLKKRDRKSAHVHRRALTFPDELAKILSESRHHSEIIAWSADDGSKVVVKDPCRLETSVLPKYCAFLRKMASFQFQLRAFGFVPVGNDEADEADARGMPVRSFAHTEFVRGNDALINAEILKDRAADKAALTSRHRTGFGDDSVLPTIISLAQSNTTIGRTTHLGESWGIGENNAKTVVVGPGSLERRWRALLRVDKYLGKLRKDEGLPPLMDSCTSIFRSAPLHASSPYFGGGVSNRGGVRECRQGHQPATSKKRPSQRGRSSASLPKSRYAKASYIFGEHYLTGSESSGDEGASVGGRLYDRVDLWATPIAMPLIESAQNRKSLHATLCGTNGQTRKSELVAWAARLAAECAVVQSGGADRKKGGLRQAGKKRHAAVVAKVDAGLINLDGKILPARKRHRPVRMYGKSDFRGVYQSNSNKWMARITVAGRKLSLGAFQTEFAAAHAYDVASNQYFGDKAKLNFPRRTERVPERKTGDTHDGSG